VAAAICHDFDFPALIRQASRKGATLLLAPSADWPEITSLHANMARMRAVENGMPMVRPTSGGRTFIADARGMLLHAQDAPRDAVVGEVVPARLDTLYGRFGDYFAWLCLALFGALAARARSAQRSNAPHTSAPAAPALVTAALVTCAFHLPMNASAQSRPLGAAEAALEECIAAAKRKDNAETTKGADKADQLYGEAERAGAAKADVLTGRARVLSQCRAPAATFLQQPGIIKRSIALLEQAIAADPNHVVAHYTLGLNYYHAPKFFGQTENALRQFELIVNRWGKRRDLAVVGDAYFFVGRVYQRLGRGEDAAAAWRKGSELFPHNARLKRIETETR
jgi:tetratricopeptide (TPR) repeat protein